MPANKQNKEKFPATPKMKDSITIELNETTGRRRNMKAELRYYSQYEALDSILNPPAAPLTQERQAKGPHTISPFEKYDRTRYRKEILNYANSAFGYKPEDEISLPKIYYNETDDCFSHRTSIPVDFLIQLENLHGTPSTEAEKNLFLEMTHEDYFEFLHRAEIHLSRHFGLSEMIFLSNDEDTPSSRPLSAGSAPRDSIGPGVMSIERGNKLIKEWMMRNGIDNSRHQINLQRVNPQFFEENLHFISTFAKLQRVKSLQQFRESVLERLFGDKVEFFEAMLDLNEVTRICIEVETISTTFKGYTQMGKSNTFAFNLWEIRPVSHIFKILRLIQDFRYRTLERIIEAKEETKLQTNIDVFLYIHVTRDILRRYGIEISAPKSSCSLWDYFESTKTGLSNFSNMLRETCDRYELPYSSVNLEDTKSGFSDLGKDLPNCALLFTVERSKRSSKLCMPPVKMHFSQSKKISGSLGDEEMISILRHSWDCNDELFMAFEKYWYPRTFEDMEDNLYCKDLNATEMLAVRGLSAKCVELLKRIGPFALKKLVEFYVFFVLNSTRGFTHDDARDLCRVSGYEHDKMFLSILFSQRTKFPATYNMDVISTEFYFVAQEISDILLRQGQVKKTARRKTWEAEICEIMAKNEEEKNPVLYSALPENASVGDMAKWIEFGGNSTFESFISGDQADKKGAKNKKKGKARLKEMILLPKTETEIPATINEANENEAPIAEEEAVTKEEDENQVSLSRPVPWDNNSKATQKSGGSKRRTIASFWSSGPSVKPQSTPITIAKQAKTENLPANDTKEEKAQTETVSITSNPEKGKEEKSRSSVPSCGASPSLAAVRRKKGAPSRGILCSAALEKNQTKAPVNKIDKSNSAGSNTAPLPLHEEQKEIKSTASMPSENDNISAVATEKKRVLLSETKEKMKKVLENATQEKIPLKKKKSGSFQVGAETANAENPVVDTLRPKDGPSRQKEEPQWRAPPTGVGLAFNLAKVLDEVAGANGEKIDAPDQQASDVVGKKMQSQQQTDPKQDTVKPGFSGRAKNLDTNVFNTKRSGSVNALEKEGWKASNSYDLFHRNFDDSGIEPLDARNYSYFSQTAPDECCDTYMKPVHSDFQMLNHAATVPLEGESYPDTPPPPPDAISERNRQGHSISIWFGRDDGGTDGGNGGGDGDFHSHFFQRYFGEEDDERVMAAWTRLGRSDCRIPCDLPRKDQKNVLRAEEIQLHALQDMVPTTPNTQPVTARQDVWPQYNHQPAADASPPVQPFHSQYDPQPTQPAQAVQPFSSHKSMSFYSQGPPQAENYADSFHAQQDVQQPYNQACVEELQALQPTHSFYGRPAVEGNWKTVPESFCNQQMHNRPNW